MYLSPVLILIPCYLVIYLSPILILISCLPCHLLYIYPILILIPCLSSLLSWSWFHFFLEIYLSLILILSPCLPWHSPQGHRSSSSRQMCTADLQAGPKKVWTNRRQGLQVNIRVYGLQHITVGWVDFRLLCELWYAHNYAGHSKVQKDDFPNIIDFGPKDVPGSL